MHTTGIQQSSRIKSLQDFNCLLILPKGHNTKRVLEINSEIEVYILDLFKSIENNKIEEMKLLFNKNEEKTFPDHEDKLTKNKPIVKEKSVYSVATLTISDRAYNKEYEKDESTETLKSYFSNNPLFILKEQMVVPDDKNQIIKVYDKFISEDYNLIITSGGTGLTSRDLTPEVTKSYIDKEATGISTLILVESLKITKFASLSRPVAGIKNNTLIVNLPGSPKAIKENLSIIESILSHALNQINNKKDFH
jgi:molybdenum cofactor synthesis domain-containing protein